MEEDEGCDGSGRGRGRRGGNGGGGGKHEVWGEDEDVNKEEPISKTKLE